MGQVLAGRYRIVAFLGSGGMGEVYEAEDQELGERGRAQDVRARDRRRRARRCERFKREIQLAPPVTHPNVCRIFDVWSTTGRTRAAPPAGLPHHGAAARRDAGRAAPRAPGRMRRPRRCRSSARSSAALAPPTPAASSTATSRAATHARRRPPAGTRAVVTDFGLRLELRSEPTTGERSRPPGELVGTPAYMAPEQVRGRARSRRRRTSTRSASCSSRWSPASCPSWARRLYTALKRLQEPAPSPRIHLPDLDPALGEDDPALPRARAGRSASPASATCCVPWALPRPRRTPPRPSGWWRATAAPRGGRTALEMGLAAAVLAAGGLGWAYWSGRLSPPPKPAAAAPGGGSWQAGGGRRPASRGGRPAVRRPRRPLGIGGRVAFELLPLELAATGRSAPSRLARWTGPSGS